MSNPTRHPQLRTCWARTPTVVMGQGLPSSPRHATSAAPQQADSSCSFCVYVGFYPNRVAKCSVCDRRLGAMRGRLRAVKGLSAVQRWSVQPCVRPFDAAHMAAGLNAFRGSGPGQKLALEVLWPEWVVLITGFDPICSTCCRPFPTVRSRRPCAAGLPAAAALAKHHKHDFGATLVVVT